MMHKKPYEPANKKMKNFSWCAHTKEEHRCTYIKEKHYE